MFMGRPVLPFESFLDERDCFFVVAVREIYWESIKNKLLKAGFEEFKSFAFWKFFDSERKMVMLHGNCHLDVISEYLESSREFNERYWIYPYKRVCELDAVRLKAYESAMGQADVWIYQHIRLDNSICKEISDEYTQRLLDKDVKCIAIPNYYCLGRIIFPQTFLHNPHNPPLSDGHDKNGFFPRYDEVIDDWVRTHGIDFSFDDLMEYLYSDNVFTEEEILDNYQNMADKICNRDEGCDVRVADYLLENLDKEQMFYDMGHPTNAVLSRIAQGILKKLDIGDADEICCSSRQCLHEDPVYPQVKRTLSLKWDRNTIRDTELSKKIANRMDFKEYVREYLYWCHSIDIKGKIWS